MGQRALIKAARPLSLVSFVVCTTLQMLAIAVGPVASLANQFLDMRELCSRGSGQQSFLSSMPRVVSGAVVEARSERDVDCVMTFQTQSILEHLLVRFEHLDIDCNDKLFVFDGAHAIGAFRANLSCESHVRGLGIIRSRTNYVTLRYVADSWASENNGFRLVLTAFKEMRTGVCANNAFKCDHSCVDRDLVCDHVQHCPNAQDEQGLDNCQGGQGLPGWLESSGTSSLSLLLLLALTLLLLGLVLVLLMMRRRSSPRSRTSSASQSTARCDEGVEWVDDSGGVVVADVAAGADVVGKRGAPWPRTRVTENNDENNALFDNHDKIEWFV